MVPPQTSGYSVRTLFPSSLQAVYSTSSTRATTTFTLSAASATTPTPCPPSRSASRSERGSPRRGDRESPGEWAGNVALSATCKFQGFIICLSGCETKATLWGKNFYCLPPIVLSSFRVRSSRCRRLSLGSGSPSSSRLDVGTSYRLVKRRKY